MPVRTRRQTRADAALRWLDEVLLHTDLSQEVLKRLNLDGLLAMRCSCSEARKLADRVFSIADAKERKSNGAWNAFSDAVREGDVFFVEVGLKQGAIPSKFTSESAGRHGQLAVLKLFYEHGVEWDAWTCLEAAQYGHLDCLVWLIEHGCPAVWGEDGDRMYTPCTQAAFGGQLRVLQWAFKKGYTCDENTCTNAASAGRIDCLKFMRDHGVPWCEDTCACAAEFGQLDCLIWLREHGCPWDGRTLRFAEMQEQHECLQWAREHGCPLHECNDASDDQPCILM